MNNEAMGLDQAMSWCWWMSVVYTMGTWTMLGSLIFFNQKKSKPLDDEVEQKDVSTNEIPEPTSKLEQKDEINVPPKGFYVGNNCHI